MQEEYQSPELLSRTLKHDSPQFLVGLGNGSRIISHAAASLFILLDKGNIVFPSQPSCTGYDIAAYTLASAFWNPDNVSCAVIKAIT